jgi:hypothetical protein
MAYLKPPWFTAKIFNPIAMRVGMGEPLTVTTRRSKRAQQIPLIPVEVAGSRYLVSTRGESDWVKNLRADPHVVLGTTDYVAREVPEQDRQPIITAYRQKAGRSVEGYIRKLPREVDHPVFALTPKG